MCPWIECRRTPPGCRAPVRHAGVRPWAGGDQHQWDPLIAHYLPDYRVVTFDITGCGASDPDLWAADRHNTLLGYADDLAALCGELGLRGVTYVGHSMSGMAGALASAADPGLFDRLVLVCASARYSDDAEAGYIGGFSESDVNGMLDAMESDFALWAAGFAPSQWATPKSRASPPSSRAASRSTGPTSA